MRYLSIALVAFAAVVLTSPEPARADYSFGSGIGLPPAPLAPFLLLPDLTPERSSGFSGFALRAGQIQPQVVVRNRGLARAGSFNVVAHVWWTEGGVRRYRQLRSRVYGLNAGRTTLRMFPILNIGRRSRATVQYVVDPVIHGGNDFVDYGRGEVAESNEGNNLMLEGRTAR